MSVIGLSRASRLYNEICAGGLSFGRLLSYSDLTAMLEEPFERHRGVIYEVSRLLEKNDQRTLVCEPREGYRIAQPNESEAIAENRLNRSARQLFRGAHTVKHTDWKALNPEEASRLREMQRGLHAVRQELSRVKRRLSKVEERLEFLEGEPTLTAEEVEFLRRLHRERG